MKEIIKQGTKPTLYFKCKLCKTEWIDSDYRIQEKPSEFNVFLIGSPSKSPMSNCPICNMSSYDYGIVEEQS